MKPSHTLDSGEVIAIEFDDGAHPVEVWDMEGLCNVAGCVCHGPSMECNKIGGLEYNHVMAGKYAATCFHTSGVTAATESDPSGTLNQCGPP